MADEPTDLTIRILRQVQETQAEHTRLLADTRRIMVDNVGLLEDQARILADQGRTLASHGRVLEGHTSRFESFERLILMVSERLAEIQAGMVTTIAYASSADGRTKALREETDDLKRRVNAIEEKV